MFEFDNQLSIMDEVIQISLKGHDNVNDTINFIFNLFIYSSTIFMRILQIRTQTKHNGTRFNLFLLRLV